MKIKFKLFHFFLSLIGLVCLGTLHSCNERLPDSKAIAAENKKRKIGRIRPLAITEEASRLGQKILSETDSIWRNNIEKELMQKIDSAHSKACSIFYRPYRSIPLSEISVTKWGRRNVKLRMVLAKERELFEAYDYSHAQPNNGSYNLQKSGDSLFIYSYQIVFNDKSCLKCHSSNRQGDFAGMFSARISKKKIVENIWLNK